MRTTRTRRRRPRGCSRTARTPPGDARPRTPPPTPTHRASASTPQHRVRVRASASLPACESSRAYVPPRWQVKTMPLSPSKVGMLAAEGKLVIPAGGAGLYMPDVPPPPQAAGGARVAPRGEAAPREAPAVGPSETESPQPALDPPPFPRAGLWDARRAGRQAFAQAPESRLWATTSSCMGSWPRTRSPRPPLPLLVQNLAKRKSSARARV